MNEIFYTPTAINWILSKHERPVFCKSSKTLVMNEAISFDTEVTSTYDKDNNKIAFMYCWMLDIFDCCIIGRNWQEFIDVINTISNFYGLNTNKYIIIYVHNLAYDFAMFRRLFKWQTIFATAPRKPLYARTFTGIEFRCSYRLSGYKLSKIGEQVGIKKLTNDFDYSKIRAPFTPLTDEERKYCIHDVKIVSEYIRRKIKEESGIIHIPLTKTGYVRRLYRAKCLYSKDGISYKKQVQLMKLTPEEYKIAKGAFAGGFTHSSMLHSGYEIDNVCSYDFASSYPAVLVAEKYPVMQGVKIEHMTREEFSKRLEKKCCIFTVELRNLKQTKFIAESYISQSRCIVCEKPVVNNGRLWKADRIITTITNVDYEIISKIYEFDLYGISDFYEYETSFLPKPFIKCLLELYATKTELKGVIGKENEYLNGKENLNASFGMCVTDIVREILDFAENGDYIPVNEKNKGKTQDEILQELEEQTRQQVNRENNKFGRFLFYLWGVFCTAYARRNLFTGIMECAGDYIYSDTDSIKIMNAQNHQDYIKRYNDWITRKVNFALDYHHLSRDLACPKTIKGKPKPLGVWEKDGDYKRFKALRAKAYFYELSDNDYKERLDYELSIFEEEHGRKITDEEIKLLKECCKYHMTVAGVNGDKATEFLVLNYKNPFDGFTRVMDIPKEYTGKMLHTYIDDSFTTTITDYKGNTGVVHEESFIHLEPIEFSMKQSKTYRDFLHGIALQYIR